MKKTSSRSHDKDQQLTCPKTINYRTIFHTTCLDSPPFTRLSHNRETRIRRSQNATRLAIALALENTISKNDSPMRKIVSQSRSRSESDPHDVNILQRASPPSPIKSHKYSSASSASTSRH